MANFMSAEGGSASGGKKTITIIIIAILALGLGYYLFKISGSQQSGSDSFDLSNVKPTDQLRPLQPNDHVLGNLEAKNLAVAFEDIQCPACKNFEPVLKALPGALKDTKVVFRHYPLTTIHKNAAPAAYAAEAAGAQGKFWEWTSLAYERQEKWSSQGNPIETFMEIARDAGVPDLDKFRNDTTNKTYKEKVQADVREATALKVQGTPTLYFNGVLLEVNGIEGIKLQAEKLYK